jgi:RNA polymerase sigma-70 factor (ECF subfamily)
MFASATLPREEIPLPSAPTVDGAGRGDGRVETEINAFLKTVEGRAFRIAQLSLRNVDDALEAVQDAMLQLVSHYGLRPATDWTPLFYRILRNRIRDTQRRRRTRNRLIPWWIGGVAEEEGAIDPIENAVSGDPGPQAMLAQRQAMEALVVAVRRLPVRQREVFLLRTLEELDVATTARVMGCSQGSVKTHYFRALTQLRKVIGDHEP